MTSIPNPDSTIRLMVASVECGARSAVPAEHEREVIELFDELRNRLLRYVLSTGISVADGEEIIQEAFLSLLQHVQQGRSRHNLRGWLFKVAHNQALKRLAGNVRRRDVAELDAAGDIRPDPGLNPEEQATFRQRHARLQTVLQALPAQDQSCLRLRAEGLRYREIAEVLGMSLGSVSASLARSLARLGRADSR